MQLLVSAANSEDASAALAGGADIVDAKNPRAGALGAVSLDRLTDIHIAVGGVRPVTAAIGDASDEGAIERLSFEFAAVGTSLVKVGFNGIGSAARVASLLAAARRGVESGSRGRSGVVAVGYADDDASVAPAALAALAAIAARAGARGILIDTTDKRGPGLRALVDADTLAAWVARVHDHGLFVALAGKLTASDLPFVRDLGADVAGVRGAACEDGRAGCVSAERVRELISTLKGTPPRKLRDRERRSRSNAIRRYKPATKARRHEEKCLLRFCPSCLLC
jgi:(5-formylfuran-3-yl)methyl phosphate synthase